MTAVCVRRGTEGGAGHTGVTGMVPAPLLRVFTEGELATLLAGAPAIDVADWRAHTEYSGYGPEDAPIIWFWAAVTRMSDDDRALLLQFATGSSVVPAHPRAAPLSGAGCSVDLGLGGEWGSRRWVGLRPWPATTSRSGSASAPYPLCAPRPAFPRQALGASGVHGAWPG
jgi:hypothetical protein